MLIALGSLTAVRLLGEPNKKPATDEQGAAQVLIAAHLIKAPKGTLAALIKTDAPVMFNAQDAATLVAKLQTKSGVDTLTMPRILTLDGQRAIVEVDPELVAAGDPAPVRVGPKLTFLPKIEGSQIELTVDMTVTEKIGMKGGIPIVSSRTFNSSMQFVDGQTALFVWPATASEPELIGLVTPTLIASESDKAEDVAKLVDGARKLQPIGVAMAWAVVEQKAASIIVPRVQFSGATFSEAVEFLRVKARQLDPEHQGINIVLPAKMPQAKLSMDLRDVPLSQALREVAQLSGLDLRYEGGAAVFGVVGQPAMTPTAASPATAKARAIILPNIKFANATLAEVVDFLRVKGREISPDKKGVNILIQDGAAAAEPKITLDLQQVSLFDALQHSATLAGYAVREDGNIFVLAPVKQFRR
ncbi:MAG: hypothetical protein U0984_04690, partial [Prosthecobacter sp.]|nr:hypothetical protein [Prosthecobacter sp.]